MKKIGLVLEGGGMKGMFTAGVLDYFLEKKLEFACIIGVSAGAIHACNYMSKQKYRSRDITLKFIRDKRYCSYHSLRTTGDLFNAKFVYYEVAEKYFKFDHATFNKSKTKLLVVATDIVTGKPEYFHIKRLDHGEIEVIRASASLPLVANIVEYNGQKYLDGGISDSLPLKKMEAEGYFKNVIVLTKPLGHRKRKSRSHMMLKRKYQDYPNLIDKVKNRYLEYNEMIAYAEEQEKAGKAFILRPDSHIKINRIDKNLTRLEAAYQNGYDEAKKRYDDLLKFINR